MAEEAGDAFDKLKAGAKAVAKKVADPNRDLGTEYEKEKIKEELEITNEMYLEQCYLDMLDSSNRSSRIN